MYARIAVRQQGGDGREGVRPLRRCPTVTLASVRSPANGGRRDRPGIRERLGDQLERAIEPILLEDASVGSHVERPEAG